MIRLLVRLTSGHGCWSQIGETHHTSRMTASTLLVDVDVDIDDAMWRTRLPLVAVKKDAEDVKEGHGHCRTSWWFQEGWHTEVNAEREKKGHPFLWIQVTAAQNLARHVLGNFGGCVFALRSDIACSDRQQQSRNF
jgi:hypothetical protein